jgi:Stealth protein CR2, conserved region 2/Stealth protein CR1, conserved region 1/Stealth protein CR3, conserved region 3
MWWRKNRGAESISLAKPEGISPAEATRGDCDWLSIDEGLACPTFPIDVVYTWVDLADPALREQLGRYRPDGAKEAIAGTVRWACHEELRFSLRSLELYAPWVNKIHIVTNGQKPAWLSTHPKVRLVTHSEILEPEYLPTFNSHVIESALHRIPGLSEHYLYLNDDLMLLRPLKPHHFFTATGVALAFLGTVDLPPGPAHEKETATNWAAKNARRLILSRGQSSIDRRLAHTCQPQRKSIAEECERMFSDEYHVFRQNRFRAQNDLLVTNYLIQNVGHLTGETLFTHAPCWYVLIRNPRAEELYRLILSERGRPQARMTVCVNDEPMGKNQAIDAEVALRTFLESYFPAKSRYEKSVRPT